MASIVAPIYSLVVPVYRSAKTLDIFYERTTAALEKITDRYEIILVDDGSPDDSFSVLERLHEKDNRVKALQLMRNVGQFRAIMCGLHHARGDFVITLDDDLQHPPEEIPKLIGALEARPDLDGIIGVPEKKKHHFVRNVGSMILRRLNQKFFRVPQDLQMGSFRILRRAVVDGMLHNNSINVTIGPLLLATTNRLANTLVEHHPRLEGKSNYNVARLIKTTLDNILNYSILPLKIVGSIGLVTAFFSVLLAFYAVGLWLFRGVGVPGWTSLMVLLSFFSGLILFTLGIIGEYLIRIIREVSREKQFLVRRSRLEEDS